MAAGVSDKMWSLEELVERTSKLRGAMAVVYLSNPYVLGSAFMGLIVFGAAAYYIRRATALSQFINEHCPELWSKLSWGNPARLVYSLRLPAQRIEFLVLFNRAAKDHPDNSEFKRLLSESRRYAGICLFAFVTAVILLGKADIH